MSYRVKITDRVLRKITCWHLTDYALVEINLRLRERMGKSPTQNLLRLVNPFDGMVYHCSLIEPTNRLCEHLFWFLVVYGQDEETLIVANAGYLRRFGI